MKVRQVYLVEVIFRYADGESGEGLLSRLVKGKKPAQMQLDDDRSWCGAKGHTIISQKIEEMPEAVNLLEAAPDWFQRDARKYGASVDLRWNSGYLELMGREFFDFFRILANCEGKIAGWSWQVRRVDGLVNFMAIYRAG